jgi:signal transduction histidine kinase
MRRQGSSRLVTRFALSSLVAFLAIGAILAVVVSGQLRSRQEDAAQFHAQFVADSVLAYVVKPSDLQAPMDVTGAPYQDLLRIVRERILIKPVVRVKIWSADGTVLFSDDPRLVGRHFAVDSDLKEGFAGETTSGVTDLEEKENVFERHLAPKLFSTYTPLYLSSTHSGAPVAVAEIYQDYAGIQSQINRLFGELAAALLLGLGALYGLLVPITRRVSRTLAEQNAKLGVQAGRLEHLLATEQRRVAELRELNRLKDEFVAVASHELRTPLTSIIGYAKTLRRPEFADDLAARDEFLDAIERQGDRLHRLVQNLLAASHAQDERRRLSFEPISFGELVREMAAGLGDAKERIRIDLAGDLPVLVSDRQCVELILSNLMDNALKFSSGGNPCEVGARAEGDWLEFWVRDDGIGIPADQTVRIFDRFYQVDSSVTRRFGGVGLGLSLVKSLVESLKGTVEVHSEPGQGSVFSVRLPLVHPDVASSDGHGPGPGPHPAAERGDGQSSGSAKSMLRSFTST